MKYKDIRKWFILAKTRAIKTTAQTAVATIGTSIAVSEVDWALVLSASILAGLLSLLTSICSLSEKG